jgi:hypothetical protein
MNEPVIDISEHLTHIARLVQSCIEAREKADWPLVRSLATQMATRAVDIRQIADANANPQ